MKNELISNPEQLLCINTVFRQLFQELLQLFIPSDFPDPGKTPDKRYLHIPHL